MISAALRTCRQSVKWRSARMSSQPLRPYAFTPIVIACDNSARAGRAPDSISRANPLALSFSCNNLSIHPVFCLHESIVTCIVTVMEIREMSNPINLASVNAGRSIFGDKPAITKHASNCARRFARLDPFCPRCKELAAGSPARKGWQASYFARKAADDEQFRHELKAHDCKRSGCMPICTFGDW